MQMLTDVTETVFYISSDHRGALMRETFPWTVLASREESRARWG